MNALKNLPGLEWAMRSPWHQAFSIVCALTVIRIVFLFTSFINLGPDEAQYWSWSTDLDFGYFSKPPMIAWLIASTTRLFGHSEAVIRLSSPLLHAATSMVIFATAKRFYDDRTALWAAVVYATVPAIAFSSALITTDVPLLFFWSIALLNFHKLLETKATDHAIYTGLAIGAGFMSKYAMIYFPLCAFVFVAITARHRWIFLSKQSAIIIGVAILCVLPNVYWNFQWGFPTFTHTAANANWQGDMYNFDKMLEFIGGQLGVFGPVLFILLIIGFVQVIRTRASNENLSNDTFLLCFCLPILAVAITQSFLSRANANWGVTAYVAGTIFVTAWTLRQNWRAILLGSTLFHVAFAGFLYLLISVPGLIEATGRSNEFKRVREWDTMGARILEVAASAPYEAVMGDDRLVTAELLYYVRPRQTSIAQWEDDGHITHHFELTIPMTKEQGRAVLLVSKKKDPASILEQFDRTSFLEEVHVETGVGKSRTLYLFSLQGYKGRNEEE